MTGITSLPPELLHMIVEDVMSFYQEGGRPFEEIRSIFNLLYVNRQLRQITLQAFPSAENGGFTCEKKTITFRRMRKIEAMDIAIDVSRTRTHHRYVMTRSFREVADMIQDFYQRDRLLAERAAMEAFNRCHL